MVNDQNDDTIGSTDNPRRCAFGGPHSGIVHYAMCDGSTKSISATIDPLTHRYLGERADREILDDSIIGQ